MRSVFGKRKNLNNFWSFLNTFINKNYKIIFVIIDGASGGVRLHFPAVLKNVFKINIIFQR